MIAESFTNIFLDSIDDMFIVAQLSGIKRAVVYRHYIKLSASVSKPTITFVMMLRGDGADYMDRLRSMGIDVVKSELVA